jgi:hypothetical protein
LHGAKLNRRARPAHPRRHNRRHGSILIPHKPRSSAITRSERSLDSRRFGRRWPASQPLSESQPQKCAGLQSARASRVKVQAVCAQTILQTHLCATAAPRFVRSCFPTASVNAAKTEDQLGRDRHLFSATVEVVELARRLQARSEPEITDINIIWPGGGFGSGCDFGDYHREGLELAHRRPFGARAACPLT